MGLGLPDGGHLTHGYYTAKKKISASSIYFQSFPYQVKKSDGLLDYEKLTENANLFKPRMIICGGSAYPRDWDYKKFAEIAKAHGAYLMCDMAHISGLVAAKVQNNPFEVCDIVTTTTHKTLRGPRAGLIFFRKDKDSEIEGRVNAAVFPACQGGPHNNVSTGKGSVELKREGKISLEISQLECMPLILASPCLFPTDFDRFTFLLCTPPSDHRRNRCCPQASRRPGLPSLRFSSHQELQSRCCQAQLSRIQASNRWI